MMLLLKIILLSWLFFIGIITGYNVALLKIGLESFKEDYEFEKENVNGVPE